MNAILITKSGAVFSLPDYRPITVNLEGMKEALRKECAFAERPNIIALGPNTFAAYYKYAFTLAQITPKNTPMVGNFLVQTEKCTTGFALTIAPRGTPNASVFQLPYKLSHDRWVLYRKMLTSDLGSQNQGYANMYTFLVRSKKDSTDESCILSSYLPNTYGDSRVCMGTNYDLNENDPYSCIDAYSKVAFDATFLNYPEATGRKIWRWKVENLAEQKFVWNGELPWHLLEQGFNFTGTGDSDLDDFPTLVTEIEEMQQNRLNIIKIIERNG